VRRKKENDKGVVVFDRVVFGVDSLLLVLLGASF
jgi:hypothetical protein